MQVNTIYTNSSKSTPSLWKYIITRQVEQDFLFCDSFPDIFAWPLCMYANKFIHSKSYFCNPLSSFKEWKISLIQSFKDIIKISPGKSNFFFFFAADGCMASQMNSGHYMQESKLPRARTPEACWNDIGCIWLTCSRARPACSYFTKTQPCGPDFLRKNWTQVNTYHLLLFSVVHFHVQVKVNSLAFAIGNFHHY